MSKFAITLVSLVALGAISCALANKQLHIRRGGQVKPGYKHFHQKNGQGSGHDGLRHKQGYVDIGSKHGHLGHLGHWQDEHLLKEYGARGFGVPKKHQRAGKRHHAGAFVKGSGSLEGSKSKFGGKGSSVHRDEFGAFEGKAAGLAAGKKELGFQHHDNGFDDFRANHKLRGSSHDKTIIRDKGSDFKSEDSLRHTKGHSRGDKFGAREEGVIAGAGSAKFAGGKSFGKKKGGFHGSEEDFKAKGGYGAGFEI